MINSYLSGPTVGINTEQDLYERMTIESIQISGQNYMYIPRTLNKLDQIFGEDVLSSFDAYAEIEMYLADFTGYSGASEMMSKFGMEIQDTASFLVSRKRYLEEVVPIVPETRNAALKWRPNEGDLIYAPFSKSLFLIKFVEDEEPGFYQLNKKYVWTLRCELVVLNNEKFNTGLTEIDDVFGASLNRLDMVIVSESGVDIVLETGGNFLLEDYVESKPFDDMRGFGDNTQMKKEFLEIIQFDPSDPFKSY
jgi:hypothetical protein